MAEHLSGGRLEINYLYFGFGDPPPFLEPPWKVVRGSSL